MKFSFSFIGYCFLLLFTLPIYAEDDHFSTAEQKDIRIKNPDIFKKSDNFIVHFEMIHPKDFCYPLPGAKLLSPYGMRRGRPHTGVDIKTKANDTIRAIFPGIVRLAKPYGAYGNVIAIRHQNGLESVYSHNSKNLVKPNQKVKAGEPIALVGRTGRATTEHLHFEMRVNGEHFNPNIILNLQKRKLRRTPVVFRKTEKGVIIRPVSPDTE